MSDITKLIKDLRNKTGAGFLDCKNALSQNDNNIEKAVEYLRKKGLAKASKKTSREANEGAVGIYNSDNINVILKINTETDFAAKSETFLKFMDELGNFALSLKNKNINKDEFLQTHYKDTSISEYFNNMIAKIGENIILNDLVVVDTEKTNSSYYVHNSYSKNIGKIISLINYQVENNDEKTLELAKNLCMHIAAMKPDSLDVGDLDQKIIENEKNIQKELIVSSGKPSNIIEKILEGKMKKFYSEVTLLNQNYILDPDKTVNEIIQEQAKNKFVILSFNILSL